MIKLSNANPAPSVFELSEDRLATSSEAASNTEGGRLEFGWARRRSDMLWASCSSLAVLSQKNFLSLASESLHSYQSAEALKLRQRNVTHNCKANWRP